MSKEKGRKWDGKSRVSNDNYRKRWNEIFKKQGIIDDKVKVGDLKKINLNEKYDAKEDVKKIIENVK
jgi:hypothetical protein